MDTLGGLTAVISDEFSRDPAALLNLYVRKAARSWYGTDSGRLEWLVLALQLPYIALSIAGSARALRIGGDAACLTALAWLVTAYFWGMTLIALSIARYMIPAMGLLFAVAPGVWPRSLVVKQIGPKIVSAGAAA
jgi:hypothetical protein